MPRILMLVFFLMVSGFAQAAEYRCNVDKKLNGEHIYSLSEIQKGQFSVLVEQRGASAFLSRCSFSYIAQKVTCDRYKVDKIEYDRNVNIVKYYVFRSQFDVQIFSSLSFVENNGRGDVACGRCDVVAP